MVTRRDRERAQRISDYVDGLVVHRRERAQDRAFTPEDREFRELAELARALSTVEFLQPGNFRDELRDRLPLMTDPPAAAPGGWTEGPRRMTRHAVNWVRERVRFSPLHTAARTAATMAPLIALVAMFVWQVASTRTASASEILNRADLALGKLVREGQILHRRWRVTDRVMGGNGTHEVSRQSISNEWMDGSDFSRVAGRNESNGRVYLAYATVREEGQVRPRVYFAPGFSNEPKGLLSVEPSRDEFNEALSHFKTNDRGKLQTYLDRGYIFEPISGERRFNRIALEIDAEGLTPLPRIVLSLREETLPSGIDVYAVRIVDPARVRFRWKSVGPPVAWLEWRETVRYIARETYLSLKAEETYQTENGRRVFTTRELLETRIVERDAMSVDPFVVQVPEGTPVRRQSAFEQLSAVAAVLKHLPENPTR